MKGRPTLLRIGVIRCVDALATLEEINHYGGTGNIAASQPVEQFTQQFVAFLLLPQQTEHRRQAAMRGEQELLIALGARPLLQPAVTFGDAHGVKERFVSQPPPFQCALYPIRHCAWGRF